MSSTQITRDVLKPLASITYLQALYELHYIFLQLYFFVIVDGKVNKSFFFRHIFDSFILEICMSKVHSIFYIVNTAMVWANFVVSSNNPLNYILKCVYLIMSSPQIAWYFCF